MKEFGRNIADNVIGAVLGLLALSVYIWTLSIGAYPGESVHLVVQAAGLFPRMAPDSPLWNAVAFLLSKIPFVDLATSLNIFSAICGALSVWLTYQVVAGAIFAAVTVNPVNEARVRLAARLAGVAAALFLAFSVPFWVVSNRAHTASFDLLLLLVVSRLFLQYAQSRSLVCLYAFTFIYGLGIVEFATFIVLAPIFAFYLIFMLWKNEELTAGVVLKLVLCGVSGLLLYLVSAWQFYGTQGYELRGYANFFQIMWFSWRDQYWLIGRSLPRVKWLLILIVTAIPWFVAVVIADRSLNEEKDWTYYILHVVMTGLALSVAYNASFAPWPTLKFGKLLVTPYLLSASLYGYLVAYWFLLPSAWWGDTEKPSELMLKKWLGPCLAGILVVLICIPPFGNLAEADARQARFVSEYAKEVVACLLKDQYLLVTDGTMDDHITVAAKDAGRRNLRLLNLRYSGDEIYMKYVASFFERPRLKNLARIGMYPLIQELFETEPDVAGKLAISGPSYFWVGGGFTVVPNRLVFNGTKNLKALDAAQLMADHKQFWLRIMPVIRKAQSSNAVSDLAGSLARYMSSIANNLGVLMEDLGEKERAFDAYNSAREMFPANVSALLNLSAMVQGGYKTSDAEKINKDMVSLISSAAARLDIWSLCRLYGFVRTPQAFSQLGLTWALSGQPGLAVSGLQKSIALMPEDKKGIVKQSLADIYLMQEHDEDSEALYYELLVENPKNQRALVGMARISARKRNFKQALDFLRKAESAGLSRPVVAFEMATVNVQAGNMAEARVMLEELIALKTTAASSADIAKIWVMMVGVLYQQADVAGMQNCIGRIEEDKTVPAYALMFAKGHLCLLENRFDEARHYFETALSKNPNNARIIELLVRLDVLEIKKELAETHVKQLLKVDPANALGNYIRGTLQEQSGELALAEDSFRKSLERRKSADVMNDLAWLLQKRGLYAEAEKLARESLLLTDRLYTVWDTLGVILMKAGRLEEAEKALEKSISLFSSDMGVLLHMSELQVLRGNKKRAVELINMISSKQGQLSSETAGEFEKIKKMMDGK